MNAHEQLTRKLLLLVLIAALLTAPVFLFAEGWSIEHLLRVIAANGATALLCALLLRALRSGHVEWVGRGLVFGLLALVAVLAWTNGEEVHVNVINFVFVTVLASVLLSRTALLVVAVLSVLVLVGIALKQPQAGLAGAGLDARLESIGQFLPTYTVIVFVLWLREHAASAHAARND